MNAPTLVTHRGGCHCGAVVFETEAPADLLVDDCNCSICTKAGYWHLIVPQQRFRLLQGRDALTEYTFGTGVARHLFCNRCGVKSFYVPRSNPDGISVNARCLDRATVASVTIEPFDGQNWERSAGALRHLSEPG